MRKQEEVFRLSWDRDLKRIEQFFVRSDPWMIPQLSTRVCIASYAAKVLRSGVVLASVLEEQDRGMVAFYCNDLVSRVGYITYLAVDPASRGRGLGRILLERTFAEMTSKGMEVAKLEVHQDNEAALRLYRRCGFQECAPINAEVAAGAIYMARSLGPAN